MGVKVRERPKGSGIYWVFTDHEGTRKANKIGTNKKLAFEYAKRLEARIVLGQFDPHEDAKDETPTLRQYVFGWTDRDGEKHAGWLDKYAKLSLKSSTWSVYENLLKVHILPEMGNRRLDDITQRMVGDFIVNKFGQGLRSQTVKNLKNCLGSILRYAHSPDQYIDSNPARGIVVPKPEDEEPSREPDPFSWEDRRLMEDAFLKHSPKFYPLVLTAFRTGLRIGELFGLQWQDIDFVHRLISVRRNVVNGKVTTPKSRAGKRDVRMTSQLADELKALMATRKRQKLEKGWKSVPDWLFCNEKGGFLDYDNFLKGVWNPAVEKSGLRRRTPHDMRHTYATLRLSKGDSLAEVSKEMGHSSSDITYRTYYKWLPKESKTNIDELDDTQPPATYTQPDTKKGLTESDITN
jgi:integrase